jgi:hypothetical protein
MRSHAVWVPDLAFELRGLKRALSRFHPELQRFGIKAFKTSKPTLRKRRAGLPKIRLPGVAVIITALVDVAEWCPCVAARVGGVA